MNKETFGTLEEDFFRGPLLLGMELEQELSNNAIVSSETCLAFGLLLGHEAAGFLCDSWQDKTSPMPSEINESRLLKMKKGGEWRSIVLHPKHLRYESFLFCLVLPRMLLVQMLSWEGTEMALKTLCYRKKEEFLCCLPSPSRIDFVKFWRISVFILSVKLTEWLDN